MKKIWSRLKGNKTIICLLVVSFASQSFAVRWLGVDTCAILKWIFGTGGVLSIIDHVKSGNLKKK